MSPMLSAYLCMPSIHDNRTNKRVERFYDLYASGSPEYDIPWWQRPVRIPLLLPKLVGFLIRGLEHWSRGRGAGRGA